MTLGMSSQLRLVVLLLVLGVVCLSAGVLVLPKLKTSSDPAATVAATTEAPATTAPAPATTPAPAPKPAAPPAPARPALPDAPPAPAAVARVLASSPVTVVALYSPGAEVDAKALAAARRGAATAGAGFAAVDVADEASARWLVAGFDGTTDPAVLVFRNGQLATTLQGYVDEEIVAQAASR